MNPENGTEIAIETHETAEPDVKEIRKRKKEAAGHIKLRSRQLSRAKPAGVSPFQYIRAFISGRLDGKNGLPRLSIPEGAEWNSPFINRKVNSYQEFCSCSWAELQFENEPRFIELENYLSDVRSLQARLEEAENELEDLKEALNRAPAVSRKRGEESLSEEQVSARRNREKAKKLNQAKTKILQINQEIHTNIQLMMKVRNKIIEADHDVSLICGKVRDRTHQIIDVYWNSAMRVHPEARNMPVSAETELKCSSEETYMEQHKTLKLEVEEILRSNGDDSSRQDNNKAEEGGR